VLAGFAKKGFMDTVLLATKPRSESMNPQSAFCPNIKCHARSQQARENIKIHSQAEKRYNCTECGTTFSATKGTSGLDRPACKLNDNRVGRLYRYADHLPMILNLIDRLFYVDIIV